MRSVSKMGTKVTRSTGVLRRESKPTGRYLGRKVVSRKAGYRFYEKEEGPKRGRIEITKGYARQGKLYVPDGTINPVPPGKFRAGFAKAKEEIERIINDIVKTMEVNDAIKEIEVTISFSADGKFLGFGLGGSASMKIKIAP
jgi:hypothetical protein